MSATRSSSSRWHGRSTSCPTIPRRSALGRLSTTPMVVFLLAGGVLTDRIERRKMMIAADVIRALAMAGGCARSARERSSSGSSRCARPSTGSATRSSRRRSARSCPRSSRGAARAGERARPVRPPDRGHARPGARGSDRAIAGAGTSFVVDAATFGASTTRGAALTPRPFEPGRAGRRGASSRGIRVRARANLALGDARGRWPAQRRARRAQRAAPVRGEERPARVGRRARRGLLGDGRRRRSSARRLRAARAAAPLRGRDVRRLGVGDRS